MIPTIGEKIPKLDDDEVKLLTSYERKIYEILLKLVCGVEK